MNKEKRLGSKNFTFLLALAVFAVVVVIRYFDFVMSKYNTTLYALSYKYAFISRGMLGSLWQILQKVSGINLMNYKAVYYFNIGLTFLLFVILFCFFIVCLKNCTEKSQANMRYLVSMLAIFTFPMFLSDENFGRLDVMLLLLTMAAVIFLIQQRGEWLVIPICILCVCIHQGYVFMNANIILVMLFYRIMTCEKKKRKKYIALLAITFLSISVLFLYFEFFSHAQGAEIYDEVVAAAKSLSENGQEYNETIIKHEILGEDVYQDEIAYHRYNRWDFLFFLLFFSPYLVIACHFFKGLFQKVSDKGEEAAILQKLAYAGVLFGVVTVIPQMILKIDYGRYMFMIFFYYIAIVMALIAMGDKTVEEQLEATKKQMKSRIPVPQMIIVYPMLFLPFYDIMISQSLGKIVFWFLGLIGYSIV